MERKKLKAVSSKFARSIVVPLAVIFSLLILFVITLVFYSFIRDLKKNVLQTKQAQLEYVEQNLSNRLKEVFRISYGIGNDDYFSFEPIPDSKHSALSLCSMLSRFLTGNDFISSIVYYRLSEPDKFYTSSGEFSFHGFWNGVLNFKDYNESAYLPAIQAIRANKVLPAAESGQGQHFLIVINPLPLFSTKPKAWTISYLSAAMM